jgi:hypothetical protein
MIKKRKNAKRETITTTSTHKSASPMTSRHTRRIAHVLDRKCEEQLPRRTRADDLLRGILQAYDAHSLSYPNNNSSPTDHRQHTHPYLIMLAMAFERQGRGISALWAKLDLPMRAQIWAYVQAQPGYTLLDALLLSVSIVAPLDAVEFGVVWDIQNSESGDDLMAMGLDGYFQPSLPSCLLYAGFDVKQLYFAPTCLTLKSIMYALTLLDWQMDLGKCANLTRTQALDLGARVLPYNGSHLMAPSAHIISQATQAQREAWHTDGLPLVLEKQSYYGRFWSLHSKLCTH